MSFRYTSEQIARLLSGLAVFVVLSLFLAAACPAQSAPTAPPQPRVVRMPGIAFVELSKYYGVTFCTDDGVYSFINAELDSLKTRVTIVHEAMHRQQWARFAARSRGTALQCAAFNAWYQTPAGKLDSEAEAYMAGWCEGVRPGEDADALRSALTQTLEHTLGGEVNRLSVVQAMQRYVGCGK